MTNRRIVPVITGSALGALLFTSASVLAQTPPRLSLRDAEQRALAGHPDIAAAQAAAQASQQTVREVRSAYWPAIFGNVTGAAASPDGSRITAGALNNPSIFDRLAAGAIASQLVTDFGRTGNLVQTQKLRAGAQEQDVTLTRAEVLLDVDRAYFDTLRAQAVERVAMQTVDTRQLVVDQVTALANSGLRSGLDLSFARVNLSQAQVLLVEAQGDVQSAFAALNTAMGAPQTSTYQLVDEPLVPPATSDASAMIGEALRDRPDVAAERLSAQAAASFARAERALLLPVVSGVATAGVTPYRNSALGEHYSAAGFNVTVPVFNGGLFSARHAEAAYRAEAADASLRDLENRVARDVTLAWVRVRTAYQRVALTNQLVMQASDALDLAQQRYAMGLSSIVELTQAQLNKTQADIDQASALYDYQAKTSALKYQTGSLR
jgi:outer membrane protein